MKTKILEKEELLGEAADRIAALLAAKPDAVLAFSTGRTAQDLFALLAEIVMDATMAEWIKNEDIRPCPFCGGKGSMNGMTFFWISCEDCGAELPTAPTRGEAIAQWNRRAYDGVLVSTDEMPSDAEDGEQVLSIEECEEMISEEGTEGSEE